MNKCSCAVGGGVRVGVVTCTTAADVKSNILCAAEGCAIAATEV